MQRRTGIFNVDGAMHVSLEYKRSVMVENIFVSRRKRTEVGISCASKWPPLVCTATLSVDEREFVNLMGIVARGRDCTAILSLRQSERSI
jgi:hypothetical protein